MFNNIFICFYSVPFIFVHPKRSRVCLASFNRLLFYFSVSTFFCLTGVHTKNSETSACFHTTNIETCFRPAIKCAKKSATNNWNTPKFTITNTSSDGVQSNSSSKTHTSGRETEGEFAVGKPSNIGTAFPTKQPQPLWWFAAGCKKVRIGDDSKSYVEKHQ